MKLINMHRKFIEVPKITQANIYITKDNKPYELANEYTKIEEIKEQIKEIYKNIKKIEIRKKSGLLNTRNEKKEVLTIKKGKLGKYKSNNLSKIKNTEIINKKKHLFTLISKKIKIIILINVEKRFKPIKLD